MSKIAREIAAVLAAYDCIYLGEASSTARLIDRVLEGKIIKRSELDGLRRCNSNLSAAATELEEELNQYRQAEEVETKLDNDVVARQAEINRKFDGYNALAFPTTATWTWASSSVTEQVNKEIARLDKIVADEVAGVGKLSATPLPTEVSAEKQDRKNELAAHKAIWRDFLSCIGFKN